MLFRFLYMKPDLREKLGHREFKKRLLNSTRLAKNGNVDWLLFGGPTSGIFRTVLGSPWLGLIPRRFIASLFVNRAQLASIAGEDTDVGDFYAEAYLRLGSSLFLRKGLIVVYSRALVRRESSATIVVTESGLPCLEVEKGIAWPLFAEAHSARRRVIVTRDKIFVLVARSVSFTKKSEHTRLENHPKGGLNCVKRHRQSLVHLMLSPSSVKLYQAFQVKLMKLSLLKIIRQMGR